MRTVSSSTSRRTLLLLAACIAGATAVGGQQADLAPTTVAVVNGEVITIEDLEESLEELHGVVEPTQRSAANLDRLLFKIVNDVLIGQEARSLGLHEESPVPESIERNRQNLAVSLLRRAEIKEPSQPEEEEIVELFQERYRKASFYVLTAADRAGGEAILDSLRNGLDIEVVAAEQSIDPYSEQGGLLEGVARKDLQLAIAEVVFRLSPNEVAGPVETDLGWSVIVARSFEEPDQELFEEVRESLARLVRQRKEAAASERLLAELRSTHPVTINEALVASIEPIRRPDGRLTAESPGTGTVVATIGDDFEVTGDEYAVALERRWRTIPDEMAARAAGPIILETLIDEKLLLAEAYSRGYGEIPPVRRALHSLESQMIIPKYLSTVVAAGIEISDDEMRAHYEEVKETLRRPPRLRLGRITVPTREEADTVASALRSGSDLAWLAGRHSTDELRGKGGDQGWTEVKPDGSALNSTLLEAQPGTTLDPVEREDSWVVYKVLAREEQGVFSYEEVSGNMKEAIFRRKFTENLDRFITTARSRSEIEVRDEVLAALQLSGTEEIDEAPQVHGGHGRD